MNQQTFDQTLAAIGERPVVVYHDHCPDGVAAAWVCRKRWPSCDLLPARYGEPPPLDELRGRDVVVVDFSWKRDAMLVVACAARRCIVLDHHKTAKEELDGNPFALFDEHRSGCGIAWDVLVGGQMPQALQAIQDRDLWRFGLHSTKPFMAWFGTLSLSVDSVALAVSFNARQFAEVVELGHSILAYHRQLVADTVKHARTIRICEYEVPFVPCQTPQLISDVGHALCESAPFSATLRVLNDGKRVFSLRSREDGVDVSEVAKRFGGGGHRCAAGFTKEPCIEMTEGLRLMRKGMDPR